MKYKKLYNGLLKSDQKALDRILELTKDDLEKQINYLVKDCPEVDAINVQKILVNVYVTSLESYREKALKSTPELFGSFNNDTILIRCIETLFTYSWIILCLQEWIKACLERNYFANEDFPDKRLIELEEIFDGLELKLRGQLKESMIKEPRRDHSISFKELICKRKVLTFIKSSAWKNRPIIDNGTNDDQDFPDELDEPEEKTDMEEKLEVLGKVLPPDVIEDFNNGTEELSRTFFDQFKKRCKIKQKHMQMFIMRKVHKISHKEVAKTFNVSERTSVTTVNRVKEKLKKCLEKIINNRD